MTTPDHSKPEGSGADADRPAATPEDSDTQTSDTTAEAEGTGRPRVVTAEISRDRGWKSMVHVVLERDGHTEEARQDAVGEEVVLLRCAAETTLEALHRLIDRPDHFALVGAKRVLAFDSAVILACVRTVGGRPRKLIGCVPISEDPVLAVARAVLHATNRIVEGLPTDAEASIDEDGADAAYDDETDPEPADDPDT